MNNIVMVTGAGGGLARTASKLLDENGWQVARVTRNAGQFDGLADTIGEIIEADVSTPQGAEAAVVVLSIQRMP